MRITNVMRDSIHRELLDRRINTLRKKMDERETELALRIYRSVIPEAVERKANAINKEVPGICSVGQNIYVTSENYSGYLFLGTSYVQPHGRISFNARISEEFSVEVDAVFRERKSWEADHRAAADQARALLAKFATAEALYAGWPEIAAIAKPIIDEEIEKKLAARKRQDIMVVPAELNATFSLPVDDVEETEELEKA